MSEAESVSLYVGANSSQKMAYFSLIVFYIISDMDIFLFYPNKFVNIDNKLNLTVQGHAH